VRAEFGTYSRAFVDGGFVAIGWLLDRDLSPDTTRESLAEAYRSAHPSDSNFVVGQQVGQIGRMVLDMAVGDLVITPDANTELLHCGRIVSDYYFEPGDRACPYSHRRRVDWFKAPLLRSGLSVPLQNTLRSSLTVFSVSQVEEVLVAVGLLAEPPPKSKASYDPHLTVLEQILELDDKEFEILVAALLTALGFEGSEAVGKTGDGGVDATGELNVFVQAKRYKLGSRITGSTVRQLRQAIPFGGQGAFITTADFQKQALEVALEPGFPRIGLINGRQLVDLLVEHWDNIPEFHERLGLKRGLVLI
jgi:restriction system protein